MIEYRIYSNAGAGGPVDYSAPVATVAGLSWPTPPLAPGSDTTFAVRAFDAATGLEESNVDCRVRIALDADGNDVTALPNAPVFVSARPTRGGGAVVSWRYNPAGQAGPPVGFRVYVGGSGRAPLLTGGFGAAGGRRSLVTGGTRASGAAVDYSLAAATVPYAGALDATATLAGLDSGREYRLAVRAYSAAGEEGNLGSVPLVPDSAGPAAPAGLTATPTFLAGA